MGYNFSVYILYFLGRKKPTCTNIRCLFLNIPVTCVFLSREIHRFQCLPRMSHRPCAVFMRSYINVTSGNDSLRLLSEKAVSVPIRPRTDLPRAPQCVWCHLTLPEAPVCTTWFAFENKALALPGHVTHSRWLHAYWRTLISLLH